MTEIKNLKKVAERILKAIKKKEKIILYGDTDLDGVASIVILKEAIKNLEGEIAAFYFPDREKEGYGITNTALTYLKKLSPALLIASDLGISSFKEVVRAKKMGFEVIIIDHHEILDKLPKANIVVDPKQKGDKHPFKKFATCGIIFRLSKLLFKNKMPESLKKGFLELTALATIADMMPQEKENKIFIEEGLKSLEHSWRPGIRAFFQVSPSPYRDKNVSLIEKVSKIISILNVRDVEKTLPAGFRLLSGSSLSEAKKIIVKLLTKHDLRRGKIKEIIEEIEKRISKKTEPIIFEGDKEWDLSLISLAASILSAKFKKPAFIYKKIKDESQGTVRAPKGINVVSLMKTCKKYLLTYGGHPSAAGFRIKNKNLEKFKNCLIKYYNPNIAN